jgi:hypothetical protein
MISPAGVSLSSSGRLRTAVAVSRSSASEGGRQPAVRRTGGRAQQARQADPGRDKASSQVEHQDFRRVQYKFIRRAP